MRERSRGFQLQLLGIIVLPFAIVVAAVASLTALLHADSMRRIVGVRDERTCAEASARISQTVVRAQNDLLRVAARLRDADTPARALEAHVADSSGPRVYLAVTDDAGALMAGEEPEGLSGTSGRGRARAGSGTVHAAAVVTASGAAYLVESLSGRSYGVTVYIPVQEMLKAAISGLPAKDLTQAFIVDRASRVLAAAGTSAGGEDLARHVGVFEALDGRAGVSFVPARDSETVVAFNPVQPPGWALIMEESWMDEVNPLLRSSLVIPVTLAPALLLALLAAWLGARRVVGPLRDLESMANTIARGNQAIVNGPIAGVREIRHLRGILVELADRVQAGQRTLRGYIARVTDASEEERRRLARDLHDETIQDLIVLDQKIQLLASDARVRSLPGAAELDALHGDVQEQIRRVRRLTRALRPVSLDELGVVPALEALAADVQGNTRMPISFRQTGTPRALSSQEGLSIYRIVQEALANACRHSLAAGVHVDVVWQEGSLAVSVGDDGKGFTVPEDMGELSRADHYGIIGMFERASLIGARLDLSSSPGLGTRITLNLALPA